MADAINDWLDTVSGNDWLWYIKRLSANDSGATGSHVSGIYIPKKVLWAVFPTTKSGSNPDAWFTSEIMPFARSLNLRAVWYNKKTRNESRITQWRGLLSPEQTGGIVVIAFRQAGFGVNSTEACIWFCQNEAEENMVEDRTGLIEPGEGTVHFPAGRSGDEDYESLFRRALTGCTLSDSEIPAEWKVTFPSGQVLVDRALASMPVRSKDPDSRLLARRECESALFYSVEQAAVMPKIKSGFESVDAFVAYANSVMNRRKSRAGKSLELQLKAIFMEEGLQFAHGEISEDNKRPDFLFPSVEAYNKAVYPSENLRMLASKTTCKDRWRQILNEADKIPVKHLLTLQQGVSENQFLEMQNAGVALVVPYELHKSFPKSVQPHLITLKRFISETKEIL